MRPARWLAVWSLLLSACAPAPMLGALRAPPSVHPAPTAVIAVAYINRTPTPPPATATPAGPFMTDSTLPAEPAWGGAAACPGAVSAPAGRGVFHWPSDQHTLSGYDYDAVTHPGLDLAAGLGDPVYAADAGVAVYAGWNDQGYGELIILDHGNGWHSLYAHLSRIDLACGQSVAAGVVIGLAGGTGHATGPHLHFELRGAAGRVNPWRYLP